MNQFLYVAQKQCPICAKEITVTRVRSRLEMIKQDSDFCRYYKGLNPYYYDIWVCSHCGYAASHNYFEELPPAVDSVRSFLTGRKVKANFAGERTRDQAIVTYKLAIYFAEMAKLLPSRVGGLYLKLAWLFREGAQHSEEQASLEKASEYYELAFLKEKMPIGNLTELTVEYLCGELLRRTGKTAEALHFLSKVVGNPKAKQEKRILEMAREAWNEARVCYRKKAANGKKSE